MSMSKEERKLFADLYQEKLDAIYDELDDMADKISKVKIDINEGHAGFKASKKKIDKIFKEATVLWNVANYLESYIEELKHKKLDEYEENC